MSSATLAAPQGRGGDKRGPVVPIPTTHCPSSPGRVRGCDDGKVLGRRFLVLTGAHPVPHTEQHSDQYSQH